MGCVSSKYTPPPPPRNRNRNRYRNRNRNHREEEYANSGSAPKPISRKKQVEVVVSGNDKAATSGVGGGEGDKLLGVANARNDDNDKSEVVNGNNVIISRPESDQEKKKSGSHEEQYWPKWLVDNIPQNVLATLVPKSADSYQKLDKVNHNSGSVII